MEETGTLIANTIHTMSIMFRQMVVGDSWGLTVEPKLLPAAAGSLVVAGTCLLRKFPLSVEGAFELFPRVDASSTRAELLLENRPARPVTCPCWCSIGGLSVPLPRTTRGSSMVPEELTEMTVGLCDFMLGSVDLTVMGAGEVKFSKGLGTGVAGPSVDFINNWAVGASSTPRTSRRTMVWDTSNSGDPITCSLSFRPHGGSTSADERGSVEGHNCLESVRSWGFFLSSVSSLTDSNLDIMLLPLFTVSELGHKRWVTWLSVLTVLGMTVFVSSLMEGGRPAVGRTIFEDDAPLGDHSPLVEPSWCQSGEGGLVWDKELLWVVAMETESWDVWLRYSSGADKVTPMVSARNARTPAETPREF